MTTPAAAPAADETAALDEVLDGSPTGATGAEQERRRPLARRIAVGVLVVSLLLVAVLATRPAAEDQARAEPLVGQVAPGVAGTALDGRGFDLAAQRGKWVVVNFFATWCQPCRQEHPELKAFAEEHASKGDATVIAVAYDQKDLSDARSFFAQFGGTWPVLPDPAGHMAVDYGVRGLPESYVVGPDGKIAYHFTGKVTANALDMIVGTA